MKIEPKQFRVRPGQKVRLKAWPTDIDPICPTKKAYKKRLKEHVLKLTERQELLYAHNRYSLLIIFQAMDAAGKDSAIKHVMSGVNPQGCQVYSFKHPSAKELAHDFLWRTESCLPERGHIGIFNRSYYEEVLIVRVHPEILKGESLPEKTDTSRHLWEHRYESITDFERHLHRNGTHILKFFLHISKKTQAERFLERIESPDKRWKFNIDDMKERTFWNDYMKAYEDCLTATSSPQSPWYVVPADNKKNARLIISQAILDAIDELKMTYPSPTLKQVKEFRAMRGLLEKR